MEAYERAIMEDAERYDATAEAVRFDPEPADVPGHDKTANDLLTPQQHLAMAEVVLKVAGRKGGPTKERAEQMARNHRVLAAASLIASGSRRRSALAPARRRHARLQRAGNAGRIRGGRTAARTGFR